MMPSLLAANELISALIFYQIDREILVKIIM
jgi:hypothetical protein